MEEINAAEVAKILNVSRSTVQRWIESGVLVPTNKPNPLLKRQDWRFDRATIEKMKS